MTKLQFQDLPLDAITPYPRNPRLHSKEQIKQLTRSIKEFGFLVPVLVDGNNQLIAWHGRVMAAKAMGMPTVPALRADHLTEAQRQAYVIADNQLTLNSTWSQDLLAQEIQALESLDFDLSLLGFPSFELDELLTKVTGLPEDIDDAPEPPENPVSHPGDVWLLGPHRLVCGDCTDPDVVASCLNGVSPHLMVTDPPYGVEYDADWRNKALRADGTPSDGRAVGKVQNDARADWREAWALFPGSTAYVWHAGNKAHLVAQSLETSGFVLRAQVIWAKNQFVIGRGNYHPQHEPCWYAVRDGQNVHWSGDRTQSTLWQINKPRKSETGHSTQKPVECMRRPIENNSSRGQAVYDPFVGSGTTIIAAEVMGRVCHAIELHPPYVDVCCLRYQQHTGVEPRLADGTPWSDVARQRLGAAAT